MASTYGKRNTEIRTFASMICDVREEKLGCTAVFFSFLVFFFFFSRGGCSLQRCSYYYTPYVFLVPFFFFSFLWLSFHSLGTHVRGNANWINFSPFQTRKTEERKKNPTLLPFHPYYEIFPFLIRMPIRVSFLPFFPTFFYSSKNRDITFECR